MKILFLSDIHGSSTVFEKSINIVKKYNIDVLIISGDLTGKNIHPIIIEKDNYTFDIDGCKRSVSESEIVLYETKLSEQGHYFFRISKEDFSTLREKNIFELLDLSILERLNNWLIRLSKLVDSEHITVIITPGNDDILEVDNLIKKYEHKGIFSGLSNSIKMGINEIISLDYSNITPWKTYRELPEKELEKLIKSKVKSVDNIRFSIFNFHCPPYNTKLDIAPTIDNNFHYIINPGGIENKHVGSIAVRKSIEQYQPLLTLHGHIHESEGFHYIGKTLSVNPGSAFEIGLLKAFIVDINDEGFITDYKFISE
jgi:Icc-related predicted phosphoesterase